MDEIEELKKLMNDEMWILNKLMKDIKEIRDRGLDYLEQLKSDCEYKLGYITNSQSDFLEFLQKLAPCNLDTMEREFWKEFMGDENQEIYKIETSLYQLWNDLENKFGNIIAKQNNNMDTWIKEREKRLDKMNTFLIALAGKGERKNIIKERKEEQKVNAIEKIIKERDTIKEIEKEYKDRHKKDVENMVSEEREREERKKLTKEMKWTIMARDRATCQYCGITGVPMVIEHIIPLRRGGKTTLENCVVSCVKCNNRKGNKLLEEIGMTLIKRKRRRIKKIRGIERATREKTLLLPY